MSMAVDYFGDGEFSFITDTNTRNMYSDAHRVITRLKLWNWFRANSPRDNSYTFWNNPTMEQINTELAKTRSGQGHSGYTYGCTMHAMKYIADHGYESFQIKIVSNIDIL